MQMTAPQLAEAALAEEDPFMFWLLCGAVCERLDDAHWAEKQLLWDYGHEEAGRRRMTRDEHLEWAKKRALEYVDRGELEQGLTSMLSDLSKHEELKNHLGIELGVELSLIGALRSERVMRRFIEGFN